MLKHLLYISLRSIKKKPWLNATILLGLSVGLSAFALILYYYQYQTSFDKFHPQSDRLYRVVMTKYINGELISERPDTYPMLAQLLNGEVPEIELAQQIMQGGGTLINFGNETDPKLRDDLKVLNADPEFFGLFHVALHSGGFEQLQLPFTGLISEDIAETYFQGLNPIGQEWIEDDGQGYRIIGVFKKWEGNSHLEFDLIKSFESIGERHDVDFHRNSWDWDRMKVYVLLTEGANATQVRNKIDSIIVKNKPANPNIQLEEYLSLQPVSEIRLQSDFEAKAFLAKESNRVYGLLVIGIIILGIAWINFINFNLSLGLDRLRNMGVQKSLGATFGYFLKKQFVESIIMNAIGLGLAISLWQIFKPMVDEFAGINTYYQPAFDFYLILTAVSLIGVFLTFLAPLILSGRAGIIQALKGKLSQAKLGTPVIRKVLVTFQWVVSITLIITISVINNQLYVLAEVNRGVRTEGILVLKGPRSFDYERFSANPDIVKNELEQISGVVSVASSYAVPGQTPYAYEIREEGKPLSANVFIPEHQVDDNYINVYDHELLAGRNFDPNLSTDQTAAILNVSAVKALFGDIPLGEALGKRITSPENEYIRTVIGVIEDYYHQSPEVAHFPINFVFDSESRGFYSVRFSTNDYQNLLAQIETQYERVFPNNIFHSFSLADFYAEYQNAEERLSAMLTAFGIIAIILSVLGVSALTLLDLGKSMKNLSIRKVLGASLQDLFFHIGIGSIIRYGIACVLAIPLGFWLMQSWLAQYANRISLNLIHMLPAIVLLLVLALVLFISSRSQLNRNPTEFLKEE